jgi:hypothetical protein
MQESGQGVGASSVTFDHWHSLQVHMFHSCAPRVNDRKICRSLFAAAVLCWICFCGITMVAGAARGRLAKMHLDQKTAEKEVQEREKGK